MNVLVTTLVPDEHVTSSNSTATATATAATTVAVTAAAPAPALAASTLDSKTRHVSLPSHPWYRCSTSVV